MKTRKLEQWSPWLLLLAVIALWQLICVVFNVSEFIFPSPWRIWTQLIEYRGIIAAHAWRTYWVTMAGFGLAIVVGVMLGFLIGSSRLAYAAVYPLMTASNEGIGYLLISAGSAMQMGLAFAGLVVVGAMAMGMYELFSTIERHTTGWAHRGSQNQ